MKKKVMIGSAIVIIIGWFIFKNYKKDSIEINEPIQPIEISEKIVIEIKGEVNRPGIYIVSSTDRVYSIITLAGGLTSNAEVSGLNLAQKVYDGMVIFIPKISQNNDVDNSKVSINHASLNDLMTLKGIGEARAKAIIEYREKNGPFTSIEGLLQINGISENIYNQIKDDVCL